ncbi:MAG: hypothetical protein ABC596_05755 [Candidatus Methanosuratincola petrocarbonis]
MPVSGMSGFDGYVMVGSDVVGGINHWSITETSGTIDVSSFRATGSALEKRSSQFIPGSYSWTATFDGFLLESDTGQSSLQSAIEAGTELSLYFHVTGDKYCAGKGLITSTSPDITWDGAVTQSWDVQGTGPLSKYPTS